VNARGDDWQTRFFLGAIQIGLAIVFVPGAALILILVGLYMIAEWLVLQARALTRYLRHHPIENPFHRVLSLCRMTTIR
jgi:hypothetical protein